MLRNVTGFHHVFSPDQGVLSSQFMLHKELRLNLFSYWQGFSIVDSNCCKSRLDSLHFTDKGSNCQGKLLWRWVLMALRGPRHVKNAIPDNGGNQSNNAIFLDGSLGKPYMYGFDRLQLRISSLFYWFWWLVEDAVFTYAGPLYPMINLIKHPNKLITITYGHLHLCIGPFFISPNHQLLENFVPTPVMSLSTVF